MSYLVLARKYRPQTFGEVVKQDHVTETLSHAIEADRVAHAILFAGPRGTGKTTVARILAKAMNCQEGLTPTPCGQCQSCREITKGNAVDVFEIDGASNNSVDQVRELRDNVQYLPAHSRYKIYIIDEVHMLSIAAFNALLKTLEEPPEHVMFMFATTEVHKIPITILSRCQRHDLRRIDLAALIAHMQTLCEQEQVPVPAESLELIAREAGGSMRDALSLLDQIMAGSQGQIEHDDVLNMLGVVDREVLFEITAALMDRDVATLLEVVDRVYRLGTDIKKFYADLLEHFRNLLVIKLGDHTDGLVDLPPREIERMREQVGESAPSFLNQIFDLLFKEEVAVRLSPEPKLALEMVFFKIAQITPALSIDTLIEKLDQLKNAAYDPSSPKAETGKPGSGVSRQSPRQDEPPPMPADGNSSLYNGEHQPSATPKTKRPGDKKSAVWENVLARVAEISPALASNLAGSQLETIADTGFEIIITGNEFNLKLIQRTKNKEILGKICHEIMGKPVALTFKVDPKQKKNSRDKFEKNEKQKQQALNHPLVAEALEIFQGKVIDVKILQEDDQ
jgi:DNA polymerase III subunit gamma/tau